MEDDATLRRMLMMTLREAGFKPTDVGTGGEAMDMLSRSSLDAVVLDLGLPNGQGKAVLERLTRLRKLKDRAPSVVVISALGREEATGTYGPLGDAFLAKPFDPWELARLLKELLATRG